MKEFYTAYRTMIRISAVVAVVVALMFLCDQVFFSPGARAQAQAPVEDLDAKLDRRISLDLRDMNVVDVYKFLAVKGDFNISISKNIAGRVTLYLNSVSIRDALDIISIANSLAYKIVSRDIIHIMTDAEFLSMYGKKFSDKTEMKIIYLSYAKPSYVLEALKNIKSEVGKIVIDEDTGSVVMIDMPESIKKMEEAIRKMDHPLETKIYNLQYANAEEIAVKLKEKIDNKAVGSVQADLRSNQLIVRAFPERLAEVDAIVSALDKRTKAVLIEVRILKVLINPKFDTGINWQGIIKKTEIAGLKNLTFLGAFPINPTAVGATATSIGNLGEIAFGNFNSDDLSADLRMLKQVLETKVIATPTLMVTNNKEARIHIGDKLAYVTTTTIGTGESQRVNEEIHYIDVGTKFKVVPTINDNGFITMAITPEISSQFNTLTTPQGSKIPLINSTFVETNVLVKDGQTIIIGGLRADNVSRGRQGLPYLMDAPVIGNLFENKTEDKSRTEIVILLTPHIVTGTENQTDSEVLGKVKPYKKY